MSSPYLSQLAAVFQKITDPRHKRGVRHPFAGLLALVFLGTLAGMTEIAVIRRWAKNHWKELQTPLGFKRKTPAATTISRTLAQYSVDEFQRALADVFQKYSSTPFSPNKTPPSSPPSTGKPPAKLGTCIVEIRGDPIHMLNVFVHDVRVTLAQWSVRGDKTDEPGCLKAHAEELFAQYPLLRLLTGDAIFAQRPLIEVLRNYGCDYLFQVRENQHDTLETLKFHFKDAASTEPDDVTVEKKAAA